MRLPASPVRVGTVRAAAAAEDRAPARLVGAAPPVEALRLPRFDEPRVRWGGDSVLRRMPLTRQSRAIGARAPLRGSALRKRRSSGRKR